eukprot:Em0018g120a
MCCPDCCPGGVAMTTCTLIFWPITPTPWRRPTNVIGLRSWPERPLTFRRRHHGPYHALSHVIEEEKDAESGVEFLTSSRENWKDSLYGGHLTWHLALYHLDLGNIETVLAEYDSVLCDKVGGFLGLVDAGPRFCGG